MDRSGGHKKGLVKVLHVFSTKKNATVASQPWATMERMDSETSSYAKPFPSLASHPVQV